MKRTFLAVGLCVCHALAGAGPTDYVKGPAVEYGETDIDMKFGSARGGAGTRLDAMSLGFGRGVTPWWSTEINVLAQRLPGDGTHLHSYEWENKFQLTETGEYALDLGLLVEVEPAHRNADPGELRIGPMLQTDLGRWQINANILFERDYGGAPAAGETRATALAYQWQLKYRDARTLEYGAQGFGEFGPWKHWDPRPLQIHKLGPAIFGTIRLDDHRKLRYNAAWLFGVTAAAPVHTFRSQVEVEF